jgi:hypothetical protein
MRRAASTTCATVIPLRQRKSIYIVERSLSVVQVVTVEQVPSTGKPEIKAGFFRLDRDNVL